MCAVVHRPRSAHGHGLRRTGQGDTGPGGDRLRHTGSGAQHELAEQFTVEHAGEGHRRIYQRQHLIDRGP